MALIRQNGATTQLPTTTTTPRCARQRDLASPPGLPVAGEGASFSGLVTGGASDPVVRFRDVHGREIVLVRTPLGLGPATHVEPTF